MRRFASFIRLRCLNRHYEIGSGRFTRLSSIAHAVSRFASFTIGGNFFQGHLVALQLPKDFPQLEGGCIY